MSAPSFHAQVSDRPILYSFRRCPYAMRARMALLVSGMICEIREVKLSAKPSVLIEASAKATVPVLVLPGGEMIDQSLDIMRWALALHDPERWLAGDDAERIATNDGRFKHHLDRYKYADRHGTAPEAHRTAALTILAPLEARLRETTHLRGNTRSFTDAALFPFIRQFAAVDPPWFEEQPLPQLQRWLALHVASSLFGETMIRLAPWRAGDPPVLLTGRAC